MDLKLYRPIEGLRLDEYLQLEQELAADIQEPTFFTWVVAPTVIYGKHQVREQEVNETYCREHNIQIVQRKSGGGCVYADGGNLMISYITPSTHSEQVFTQFLERLVRLLQAKGLQTVITAHNDILIDGRKVSGSACYTCPTGTIVHGTLLYDVDIDAMIQAITPTGDKLTKHGVESVRQRVVNLREVTDAFSDIQALRQYIEQNYTLYG